MIQGTNDLQQFFLMNDSIIGCWDVIKSDIPDYNLGEESFEFRRDTKFIIRFKDYEQNYSYNASRNEFNYYDSRGKRNTVRFRVFRDIMIMLPRHGFRTWLRRRNAHDGR